MDREHHVSPSARFRAFAEVTRAESPLYSQISRYVAGDADLLDLVAQAPPTQPVPNLLLGSVHEEILAGAADPLRDYYPSVGGARSPDGVGPVFKTFAMDRAAHIADVLATRRVQTNEVRRCALWVPAMALAGQNLAIVEVGASAGLNLHLDRYAYRFGDTPVGPSDSPLVLHTDIEGPVPIPRSLPAVAWRAGIDLHPVDIDDESAVGWVRALLWPEQIERMQRFDAAVSIARRDPARIVAGNALDVLADVVEPAPTTCHLVVFHSFTVNQMTADERAAFDAQLVDIASTRPVTRLSIEWLRRSSGPMLDIVEYDGRRRAERRLAAVHHHGGWIRWLDAAA